MSRSPLDLAYLEEMAAGDADTRHTMLVLLHEELERDLPRVRQLYERRDWPALVSLCHHLKSTVAFAGNTALTDANLCVWLYALGEGRSEADVETCLVTLEREGEAVKRAVEELL